MKTDRLMYRVGRPPMQVRNVMTRNRIAFGGGGTDYDISREQLTTPGGVLHWLAHLSEKTWFTAQDVRDLFFYINRYCGINPFDCERGAAPDGFDPAEIARMMDEQPT